MKSRSNFFTDREGVRTIDKFRITYFVMFLLSFGFTEIGRYVYRPFIYEHNIQDFGIADSMGNLGGIIVQSFFGLALLNPSKVQGIRVIAFFVVGYILYEVMQPILPKGVFDWKDIYGTVIGGLLCLVLFLLIHRIIKHNKVIHKF